MRLVSAGSFWLVKASVLELVEIGTTCGQGPNHFPSCSLGQGERRHLTQAEEQARHLSGLDFRLRMCLSEAMV